MSCYSQRRELLHGQPRIWTRHSISSVIFIKSSIRFEIEHWALTLVLGLCIMSTAFTLYGIAGLVPCNYGGTSASFNTGVLADQPLVLLF